LKFKLDENMPADLATLLQDYGHDAADVFAEGLAGASDPPVLSAAAREGRVLLTFDLDFADVRNYPPGTHAGIVVFRLHDQRWQAMEGLVKRLLAQKTLEGIAQGLAVVDESRVRLKRGKNTP
jgi:predicted nuclease of predicted toxin-antitoxin system